MGILKNKKLNKKTKENAANKPAEADKVVAKASQYSHILHKPHITEKTTHQSAGSQFSFIVSKTATKQDIKQAVHAIFNLKPQSVNIINQKGKKVKFGKIEGERKKIRKAIVTLAKGQKLNIYEGI